MSETLTHLTRSGLDLDIAVILAEAANTAYKPGIMIRAWAASHGFGSQCTPFDHDNIQGFWCVKDDIALLSFRGTSNPGQWIRDLRLIPIGHPWGSVHAGFKGGIDLAEPDMQAFQAASQNARHVWVTGHSLGGALAVLAAARLRQAGLNPFTYTYGQPRVGLSGFAERFETELPERLIRFINQSDIVPRVPPGLLYRHFGIVKTIRSNGAADSFGLESFGNETEGELVDEEQPALTEEEFAALQAQLAEPGIESFEGALPWISDHSMTEYLRLLTGIRDA